MQEVVGAAVVRHGHVLAARRTTPPETAGRWEFAGGKVEPGESAEQALVREVAEELGCVVAVDRWLDGAVEVRSGLVLRVALCTLRSGEPTPVEHDRVRWVGPDQLDDLDWLEPDRPFLPELREVLLNPGQLPYRRPVRCIFFDEDDARAAAARLLADGWDASVGRERLAGEDDDEDHPWAVLSDAPAFVLELLVDRHDGWLDLGEEQLPERPPPLDLPAAPRRIKRPPV